LNRRRIITRYYGLRDSRLESLHSHSCWQRDIEVKGLRPPGQVRGSSRLTKIAMLAHFLFPSAAACVCVCVFPRENQGNHVVWMSMCSLYNMKYLALVLAYKPSSVHLERTTQQTTISLPLSLPYTNAANGFPLSVIQNPGFSEDL
jgi:hypothetical protein